MLKTALGGGIAIALCVTGGMACAQEVITRTVLQKADFPGSQYATVMASVGILASSTVARHTHPGVETAYVLEGESDLLVEGQPPRHLKPGDTFQIPANTPHGLESGPKPVKLIGTYMVEKDKPLASPAPK